MARIREATWKRSRRLGFSILETGKELQNQRRNIKDKKERCREKNEACIAKYVKAK